MMAWSRARWRTSTRLCRNEAAAANSGAHALHYACIYFEIQQPKQRYEGTRKRFCMLHHPLHSKAQVTCYT